MIATESGRPQNRSVQNTNRQNPHERKKPPRHWDLHQCKRRRLQTVVETEDRKPGKGMIGQNPERRRSAEHAPETGLAVY